MSSHSAAGRYWVGWLAGLCLAGGCAPEKPAATEQTASARHVDVKLLVVDDPAMSDAIAALRAEWKARTGATIDISQMTADEWRAADSPPAGLDAIIYASAQLGTLAQRAWIAPLPADYKDNRELAWSDTFDLLRVVETTWGQVPYATAFGSPVLTLYYRPDLLDHLHKRPPQTWSDYHDLAETLSRRENLGDAAPPADATWYATVEPLGKGWAAPALLARAAAYAKHRDHYSTLFHIETMEPLIAGPAFVRALEELIADARLGPPNQLELDPAAARQEFLAGHAALALSWPGHAEAEKPAGPPPPTGFAELPGAAEAYNIDHQSWEKRQTDESRRVTLLGLAGRLGSVTRTSAHPSDAFQLLAWLSGREWGTNVAGASPATTLYRGSQLKTPQPWVDPLTDAAAARQYAVSVRDALNRQAYLFALRIPGRQQYLAALDAAVRDSVAGEKSPADALSAAAAEWQRITDELGKDAQRAAYRLSLGLEP